jgi:hypothetical protein
MLAPSVNTFARPTPLTRRDSLFLKTLYVSIVGLDSILFHRIFLFKTFSDKMTFKVVQSIENGVPELTAVPSDWESGGKLFWPQKHVRNRSRLIRDDRSKPSPEWDIIDCKVKRTNIETYREAENEIKIMLGHTDTDHDLNDNRSQNPVYIATGQRLEETNFDALAELVSTYLPK